MDAFEPSKILDLQKYFEDRMAKFEADLHKKASPSTGSLAEEFAMFKSFVIQSLKAFSQQLETIARELDNMEMRSRRKMLLFHGVEEQKGEETGQVVTQLVKQHLKVSTFTLEDVRRCHRMGRQTSGDKPRALLVKFESTAVRDSIWFSKSKLKGTGVTLSEFLTRSRHSAFIAAREKFGITRCWTREGNVFVLGPDGNRYRIRSVGDLNKFKLADTEKPPAAKPVAAKAKRGTAAAKK